MFRCLIKNFQRSLIISHTNPVEQHVQVAKALVCALTTNNNPPKIDQIQTENPLDSDEYVVPYRLDQESRKKNNTYVLDALRTKFRLTNSDIQRVLSDEAVHRSYRESFLTRSLELLCSYGITKETFLDCPWLITMDPKRLEYKLQDLSTLKLHDINDFVPFLRLTYPRLNKLLSSLRRESSYVPNGNRVYYISNKLELSILTVTKFLSKRLFVLEMPFDMLKQNLEHMLHYNVSPMNILKDLWAFRYTPKSVETRLERAKRAKKDKIMPWMVRCPENILQRSFQLSIDEDRILEGRESIVEYVADRLGFTVAETQAILNKHPSVLKVRITKVKEVLDYLLNEEKFTRHEIAQVPRIMCHGLKTTRQRIDELKSMGCRPSSLVIVCKSKREYGKFVNSWMEMRGKIEQSSSSSSNQTLNQ